jgi:hypothetical protein
MWAAFCAHLRECGRSGNLFVLVVLLIFAGAIFGRPGLAVLLGLLATYFAWVCFELWSQQERFEQLGRQPPLASQDLRAARVRLANSKTQRLRQEQTHRLKTQRMGATSGGLRLRPR